MGMTRMLKESGPPPPKPKLRRHKTEGANFGNDQKNVYMPPPAPIRRASSMASIQDQDEEVIQTPKPSADDDAHKAVRRSGTRSSGMDEFGRKGRRMDQDEGGEKRHRRSKSRKSETKVF